MVPARKNRLHPAAAKDAIDAGRPGVGLICIGVSSRRLDVAELPERSFRVIERKTSKKIKDKDICMFRKLLFSVCLSALFALGQFLIRELDVDSIVRDVNFNYVPIF